MKLDELLLLSGNDVPFPQAAITIHNPTLKEIGLMGEEKFHLGCRFLLFNKNNLSEEDKNNLANQSNFDIFMSIMNSPEKATYKVDIFSILSLLFPQYEIKIEKDKILLQNEQISSIINEQNYEDFKNFLIQMFCLEAENEKQYDPADALAKKIAEKIKKGKEKVGKQKGKNQKLIIYAQYASILAAGENKDLNDLMNYTIYQINDEFKRFQLKENNDIYISAKLAGAQNLEEVDNWMEDIHP